MRGLQEESVPSERTGELLERRTVVVDVTVRGPCMTQFQDEARLSARHWSRGLTQVGWCLLSRHRKRERDSLGAHRETAEGWPLLESGSGF